MWTSNIDQYIGLWIELFLRLWRSSYVSKSKFILWMIFFRSMLWNMNILNNASRHTLLAWLGTSNNIKVKHYIQYVKVGWECINTANVLHTAWKGNACSLKQNVLHVVQTMEILSHNIWLNVKCQMLTVRSFLLYEIVSYQMYTNGGRYNIPRDCRTVTYIIFQD